jgi:outer membrane protein assembly factor BamB
MKRLISSMIVGTSLFAGCALAQSPLRTAPTEKFTVNAGFRDWGPATVVGTTILAGNQTGRGGLFAVDAATGKVRWAFRPVFSSGTASVSTPPAIAGGLVITPFAMAYPGAVVAVSLATGKEVWRALDPAQGAAVAVSGDLAFVFAKNGTFYALDVATGKERWKIALSNRAECASRPIVRDDVVYFTGGASAVAGDAARPAGNYLFALDARTGQERWRLPEPARRHGGHDFRVGRVPPLRSAPCHRARPLAVRGGPAAGGWANARGGSPRVARCGRGIGRHDVWLPDRFR